MNIGDDYEVIQDETAPKGRRIVKKGQAVKAEVSAPNPKDAPRVAVFDGINMSDDDIRDEIEKLTGNRPHHRTGRAKLIAEWEEAFYGQK
jgi:hypothetical protein